MFKRIFFHALTAAALAALAGYIYCRIYYFATEVDFSKALNISKILSFSILFCMLAAIGNYLITKFFKNRGEIIFNFILSIISFALVVVPISISLPLDIKSPELFPGLAVPMVFFPALAWYTVSPVFSYKINKVKDSV